MASELLEKYGMDIKSLTLIPSGGGVYEVEMDGKLIYSKKKTGKFPELKDVTSVLDKT
jgi:selenoprotein W-related protein